MANESVPTPEAHAPAVRLVHLRLRNWKQVREADVTFPDGLIGVVGPNGSGKTGLLTAITYAFFGVEAMNVGKDTLPTRNALEDTEVILTFVVGEARYCVTRSLRRKDLASSALLERDGVEVARGADPVSKEIARLVGSLNDLTVSRFVAQKELNALSSMTASDRKKVILRLLGVDGVEQAIKDLRAKASDFDKDLKARRSILPDIDSLRTDLHAAERHVYHATKATLALDDDAAAAGARRDQADADLALIEQAGAGAAHQTATLRLTDDALADLTREDERGAAAAADLVEVERALADAEARVTRAEARRGEYAQAEDTCALRRRIPELDLIISALDGRIAACRATSAKLRTAAGQAVALEAQEHDLVVRVERAVGVAAAAAIERDALRVTLERNRKEITQILAQVSALDAAATASVCPTCAQTITDPTVFRQHLDESLVAKRADDAETVRRGTSAKARQEAAVLDNTLACDEVANVRIDLAASREAAATLRLADADLAAAESDRSAAGSQIAEARAIEHDEDAHADLSAEADAVPALTTLAAQMRGRLEERARLTIEADRRADRRATLESQRALARAQTEAAGYDPEAHDRARAEATEARAAASHAALSRARHETDVQIAGERHGNLQAKVTEHARLEADIGTILAARGQIELTRETMDRFKIYLIGKIRPALERKASVLLRDLTDKRYTDFSLDDDYEIRFGTAGRRESIRVASGGEEDILNLCLRLAISQLITESQGIGATFIVLDEVLGSQDDDRREAILEMLPRLTSHFAQVLMVAHVGSVQDRFAERIVVRFDRVTETSTIFYPEPVVSGNSEGATP